MLKMLLLTSFSTCFFIYIYAHMNVESYYDYYYYFSYGQVQFNQTEYNFSASANDPSGTKLGTTWISMPLSLVSLEDGTFSPIEIDYAYSYMNGLYLDSNPLLWSVYLGSLDLYFYVGGQHLVMEGYDLSIFLNLTQDTANFCGDEYILIPIDVYTQSDFFAIGTFEFQISFDLRINGDYFYQHTYVSVDVDPGKRTCTVRFLCSRSYTILCCIL